jgi:polynucleotide 5'-kinase involved in rRNA processing
MAPVTDRIVPHPRVQLSNQDLQGTARIVGASDPGKSTLAPVLYERRCQLGILATYRDADVGQNALGLPNTMLLALDGVRSVRFGATSWDWASRREV